MALADTYQAVVDAANQGGVTNLNVQEQDNVLYISGTAPSEEAKQAVWDAYNAIDPDMRAGDMVLTIEVSGGSDTFYTIKSGDNLTHIARDHGVSLQALIDANKASIKNPDLIFPGQKLIIPKAG
jgi:nucleoid-associated protein YgaU